MQDRYVGDIGDYAKYSLLRTICSGQVLGIAWYLFPDEVHNADGKHTSYLLEPDKWRHRDPVVFDALREIVDNNRRSVASIQTSGLFERALFASERLETNATNPRVRNEFRKQWYSRTKRTLESADVVFFDPDNGLREQEKYRWSRSKEWKCVPEQEVTDLSSQKAVVAYHHNTRRPGGHEAENRYWANRLGASFGVRMRAYSSRTFFFVGPTNGHLEKAQAWCDRWGDKYTVSIFE